MPEPPEISILIPTTRTEDLRQCLASINSQSYLDYEVLVDGERGALSKIRNNLARRAEGKYIVFIDDDTRVTREWLGAILQAFGADKTRAGVSGPCPVLSAFRQGRDIFKHTVFKWLYDSLFCPRQSRLPGTITDCGAWTTGASDRNCNYEGSVDFLEACNMAFKRDRFWEVGGFDESYSGVGEWSEPDLCFKLRARGYSLWFSLEAKLYHRPSRGGAYSKRKEQASERYQNYNRFLTRWVRPSFRREVFKLFLRIYYAIKTIER